MLGIGAYIALQKQEIDGDLQENISLQGKSGINWPVAKSMDLEVSLTGGTISY